MKLLPVTDIFGPTMQGEGPIIGGRTMFLRLAGCDFQCVWCDSKETWLKGHVQKTMMDYDEILIRLLALSTACKTLTITGGNPALHNLNPFLDLLDGWTMIVETQGSRYQEWFERLHIVVISPKGPSSGMDTDWKMLDMCVNDPAYNRALKVVVFTDDDYAYAQAVNKRYPSTPIYLSVGTYTPDLAAGNERAVKLGGMDTEIDGAGDVLRRWRDLTERVLKDGAWETDPYVLPQGHVLLWGHRKGV